jgi:hypothetical protein
MAMSAMDACNAFWKVLTSDAELLRLVLRQQTQPNPATVLIETKNLKVQKEQEPVGLATNTIPIVSIYPTPGLPHKDNHAVYDASYQADIYAATLFEAMAIGKRVFQLLTGKMLVVDDTAAFATQWMGEFGGRSGVPNIKLFSQRYQMSEAIE